MTQPMMKSSTTGPTTKPCHFLLQYVYDRSHNSNKTGKTAFYAMKSVAGILAAQSASLQSLLERAAVLDGVNHRLLPRLPAPLNAHICLANVRDDTAIIMADSSAWLTRARYIGPEILNIIRQEPGLDRIKKIHFKIQPEIQHSPPPASRPQLSENAAELIMSTAKVIDDPNLKAALHNLSRRYHKE